MESGGPPLDMDMLTNPEAVTWFLEASSHERDQLPTPLAAPLLSGGFRWSWEFRASHEA